MIQSAAACYHALVSRDPRFDGIFFVGVTSTGVYCRPICPAKTPKEANCRFFESPEAAEKERFRPCLRCRPELAPGSAPVDDAHRIAYLLAHRIDEGLVDDGANVESIADQFELSSRQLRRIVQKELGVSPIELIQTRRLLLSKQLLTETTLPITEIAFASGFSSLRRFNAAFSSRYRMAPGRLRKAATSPDAVKRTGLLPAETSTVLLGYRPPYDWHGILGFLRNRMIKGVEWISADTYHRTVRLGRHRGWIAVRHAPHERALSVEFSHSLTAVLPPLLGRLRNLFDLAARPDLIAAQLSQDRILEKAVHRNPGLRVPGAFDGFELAVRAVLGQQVTVKAATTLACRFVEAFGEPAEAPVPELTALAPSPERIAGADIDSIGRLGIVGARARSIVALARACISENLCLDVSANPEEAISRLTAIPGIGQWTAHYIAMRALRWPDAFPKEDIAIRKNLGGVTAKQAEEISKAWSPWRSYAVLHIWHNPAE